ncbi:ricin-type beta-trefoil lectin domain protein [Acinetobacter sp. GFQ9D192M]|nr:ricin-type beta-trefoil lectin domain protein [Acinetobacter sp. GFQ9D191M]NHB98991.1 ricin-type beta-trefoil lectin domain protein [Acinetobacter sp. GFQ9D192M]
MFRVLFLLGSCSILTACMVVGQTASEQVPNIIIQPEIPPATPAQHPAQKIIYVPIPMPDSTQTGMQKVKIKTYDGRCLGLNQSNQRELLASRCHDGHNQQFIFQPDQSITVQGKCLDIAGKIEHDGAAVIGYSCNGQSNQKWYLDGQRIRSVDTDKCLGRVLIWLCTK